METEGFVQFLKHGGRSPNAIRRCLKYLTEFDQYLAAQCSGIQPHTAQPEDLDCFIAKIEEHPHTSAKGHLWGLRYYFQHLENNSMSQWAAFRREERTQRTPFPLKDFRDVNERHIEELAAIGIRNIRQLLSAGSTPTKRAQLTEAKGIPAAKILELVKLSDMARIPGVKSTRARLYLETGVDTVEKLARWNPEDFQTMVVQFVKRTSFDGAPTLPAEARFTIEYARKLPKTVEF